MLWKGRRASANIEDRRGMGVPGGRIGLVGGGGIGTILLVLVGLYFGIDPSILLQGVQTTGFTPGEEQRRPLSPAEQEMAEFVAVVLADTEDTWNSLFGAQGGGYREPTLVLFSNAVESACGYASAAVGPFYCPADQKVYLDLAFFDELKNRFRAPGDFAQAYVIAHEIGHHVQNLLGISPRVEAMRRRLDESQANALSVRVELQADCFAGVWAHHADRARQVVEAGDIDEALNAAAAIGDDRLQRQATGTVMPDSFTHGTSEQRARWFRKGLETGSPQACDTFNAERL
jgi:hypothetical protein